MLLEIPTRRLVYGLLANFLPTHVIFREADDLRRRLIELVYMTSVEIYHFVLTLTFTMRQPSIFSAFHASIGTAGP